MGISGKEDGGIYILDQLTHECWSYDGKGLWFVDLVDGICYTDLSSPDRSGNELYTSYEYWHTSCSPDGKYVAGDVSGRPVGVILINPETGEEKPVTRRLKYAPDGLDPHPGFSRNSEMLMFQHDDKQTDLCTVGIIRIADVVWGEE